MPRRDGRLGSRRRVGTREEEKAQAVRLVRQLRKELGTEHGTVQRVADQLGYGVESVRTWVRQADIDEGVEAGGDDRGGASGSRSSSRRTASCAERTRSCKSASAFFAAELDRPSR